jgi:hypothetical protein
MAKQEHLPTLGGIAGGILSLPIEQLPFKRETCASVVCLRCNVIALVYCLLGVSVALAQRLRQLIACVSHDIALQLPATCSRGGAGVAPSGRVCISIGQQGIFKNSENGELFVYGQQATLKNLQMGAIVLSKW